LQCSRKMVYNALIKYKRNETVKMSEDRIIEKIGLWTLLSPPRWSEIKYYQIWHKRVSLSR